MFSLYITIVALLYCFFSPASADEFGALGFGPCPRVEPMQDFDITKIYGGKWYMITHYSEDYLLSNNLHCLQMDYRDGNPGADICRIDMTNNSTVYNTGEKNRRVYERMIVDPTEMTGFINTVFEQPVHEIILGTDYDTYIAWYQCTHFPRDNPIAHEQHNYIHSRTAVWKDPKRDLKKAFDAYESQGIDLKPFVLLDQQDCKK